MYPKFQLLSTIAIAASAAPWEGPSYTPLQNWPTPSWGSVAPRPSEAFTWHHSESFAWPHANSYQTRYSHHSTVPAAPSRTVNEPCASVSRMVAAAKATATAVPKIPALLAWQCMQSVPLNTTAAKLWVPSLRPYMNWQTTTSYLKAPPPGYLEPAVDVYGELDNIINNLAAGAYSNEYALEWAMYRLFQTTHDGHFRYTPNLVGGVFAFGRPIPLVSVSLDGKALPQVFVYADVLLARGADFAPSAVTGIDGQDASVYLENWSQYGSLQDPDALYNNVFYELAQISLGSTGTGTGTFGGGGRGAYVYPNATTSLTFANGTTSVYTNFARVLVPFTGVQTGQELYDAYLAPRPTSTSTSSARVSSTPTSTRTPTSTPAPGYPTPVIRQINNLIGGYYLEGTIDYEEIAVLSIPSFVGLGAAEDSFQQVGLKFLQESRAAGKTKLIIDVSANGGGTILQGYNLFTELFPHLMPYGATRFRAHEAFNIIGTEVSAVAGPVYPWNITARVVLDDFLGGPFDYRADVDINYKNFTSWPEKYGPHQLNGDYFTSIIRWNLSDATSIFTSGIIVTGYANRTGIVTQPFYDAADIIVVYDGYCASTCTIFSEFIRQQAGIKTIALGGRPQQGMIQAVGGVKGTNDYPWDYIYQLVNDTFYFGTADQKIAWQGTELGEYSMLPLERATPNYAVNSRDGIRQGDASETPLQFIYEPADCRIWYTPEMTVDVTAIWKAAADSTWGTGANVCIAGGVGVGKRAAVLSEHDYVVQKRASGEVDIAALIESLDVWTDLSGMLVVGDGYMMP